MHFNFYMDEAGYEKGWKNAKMEQRFHVAAAIGFPATQYVALEKSFRNTVYYEMEFNELQDLGYGVEINSSHLRSGKGLFKEESKRNQLRDYVLQFPKQNNLPAFVAVIDKQAHKKRYADPRDPTVLSIQFLMERIQKFCVERDATAHCVYDKTHAEEESILVNSAKWLKDGKVLRLNREWGSFSNRITFDNIIDFTFHDSRYSFGVQLADIFSSMTYQYHQKRKPSPCEWWDHLYGSLHEQNGTRDGVGYKLFPSLAA